MSDSKSPTKKSTIKSQVGYINRHVGELTHSEKVLVLQMIFDSTLDNKHIDEKPTGTQVSFDQMSPELIGSIYTYVYGRMEHD